MCPPPPPTCSPLCPLGASMHPEVQGALHYPALLLRCALPLHLVFDLNVCTCYGQHVQLLLAVLGCAVQSMHSSDAMQSSQAHGRVLTSMLNECTGAVN